MSRSHGLSSQFTAWFETLAIVWLRDYSVTAAAAGLLRLIWDEAWGLRRELSHGGCAAGE